MDFYVGPFVVQWVYGRGDISILMTVLHTGEVIGNAVRDLIVCGILDTVDAVGLSFSLSGNYIAAYSILHVATLLNTHPIDY